MPVLLTVLLWIFGFGNYRMGPGIDYYSGGNSLILLSIIILLLLRVI